MNIQQLEDFSPGHWFYDVNDQLKRHIYRRSEAAFAAGDAARDALNTREEVEARQRALREFFLASLGGLPPSDTPLEAQTVGVVEFDGFRVEKVVFQSRPRHYVTANLYLPNTSQDGATDSSLPAVLYLCGHHREAKHGAEYQIVCQYLVQAGLVVLAQDPIGQGERFSYYEPALGDSTVSWGTLEHDYAGAQCLLLGDGIARYFLHDAMRGIDYLLSRREVDGSRIGVTGSSGGGTQTSMMMLGDPRIAAAAPATFIMNRETYMWSGGAQDAEQIWPGFTAAGYDHEDILLAMAPRPVRVMAVTSDFFPIEGTRRTVARCKRLWGLYGREDAVDLVEDVSTHAYTPNLARAAAQFFARHLLGTEPEMDDGRIAPVEPKRLWCTSSGQVRGEMEGAEFVYEANQERLHQVVGRRASGAGRTDTRHPTPDALDWLRETVYRHRRPCDLNPRFHHDDRFEDLRVEMCLWWAQEGLFNHGYLFRDFRRDGQNLPVTLAVWDDGTNCLRPHLDWIRQTCAAGRAVLVLDVSGSGPLAPRSITSSAPDAFYGVIHKLSTDLIWLDDDLAALRTFDTLRALDMIERWPGLDASEIRVYAHGRQGLYGRLAAMLDARIRSVEVVDGLTSFADWVRARHYDSQGIYALILRGVLRHFDLPVSDAPV